MHGECLIMGGALRWQTLPYNMIARQNSLIFRRTVGPPHTHPCKARYADSILFIPFILIAWDSLYNLSRPGANTNVAYQRARSAQH